MSIRRTINLLLVSILLVLTVSACTNPFNPNPSILGTWRGQYLGYNIIMAFNEDGTLNFYGYGGFQNGTYTINTEATPHQLDLTFPDTETIYTIVEFVNANTLKLENTSPGQERPTEFSDFMLLTRERK